jgi:hypothetical protein
MVGRIATLVGYWKAPRWTFMLKHPIKGPKAYLATRRLKGMVTRRRGLALAAVAAVPVVWAARRGRNNNP